MYKDHFGLREAPFRITPHTGRFFSGAQRGAVLEALSFAIQHDEGVIRVTGEVGTGKTMLCRMLLEQLPDNIQTIYLANPSLAPHELLKVLREELGLPAEANDGVLRNIEKQLIHLHAEGKKVVAIIDEAHAMPRESLEQIRLLSNLETSTHKLLHIALFGQPELNAILAEPAMRSLRERITQSFELEPLKQVDIAAYLDFRLRAAGYKGPALFAETQLALLARASRGLTRRINILADKALLAAFAENTHTITQEHIQSAVKDAQFALHSKRFELSRKVIAAGAICLVSAIMGIGVWGLVRSSAETGTSPKQSPELTQPHPILEQSTQPQTPASLPTAATENQTQPQTPALGPLAQQLLEQSRKQIDTIPDNQWFIQLRSTPAKDTAALESFIMAARKYLQADLLQLYVARDTPGPQIGVVYGPFAESASAQKTLEHLPPWVRAHGAFIRRYKSLR